MGSITTQHQNSEGLAKGLLPFVQTALPNSTCRPWNRHDSQQTSWLISPVREWPIYRPCKYYTSMSRADDPKDSTLTAGIYVEKGYGGDALTVHKPNEGMDRRWGWYTVKDGFISGRLTQVLKDINNKFNGCACICISGGYDEKTHGEYILRSDNDTDGAVTVEPVKAVRHLVAVESINVWQDMAGVMDKLTEDGWLWVDLHVYVRMSIGARSDEPDGKAWLDSKIWNELLEPFLPWVSKA